MGKMALMDASGHIELEWTATSIAIDLRPAEGKANQSERQAISKMIKDGLERGMTIIIDGKPCCKQDFEEIGKKVQKVRMKVAPVDVKALLEDLFQAKVFANQILFEINKSGVGTLVQKTVSEFKVDPNDEKTYKGAKPLRGG